MCIYFVCVCVWDAVSLNSYLHLHNGPLLFCFLSLEPFLPRCFFLVWSAVKGYTSSTTRLSTGLRLANQSPLSRELIWTLVGRKPFPSDHQLWVLAKTEESKDLASIRCSMKSIQKKARLRGENVISCSNNEGSCGPKQICPCTFRLCDPISWPSSFHFLLKVVSLRLLLLAFYYSTDWWSLMWLANKDLKPTMPSS